MAQTNPPQIIQSVSDHTLGETRCFKDPVFDLISFDILVCKIIDTPQFQRLRYLKQLGTSYFVFPGASHNRFEHCLGTAHLAKKLVCHLQTKQPYLGIDSRDVECVTIAGLCHDLGHGPFSHVFDNHFIPAAKGPRSDGTFWCHEEASEMMLDALVRESEIPLSQDRVDFIKDLIRGEPRLSLNRSPPEKKFLFEIVANKRNGIDVDKWDYIARDTRAVGESCTLVASRLIEAARVIGDTIAYNWKDSQSVYELFYSRYSLHKRVYNHKTAKAIEYMIVEALLAAEPVFHLADAIDDPAKYLYVTDSLIEDIERRDDPRLAKSKKIIKDIKARRIPKRVEEKCLPWQFKAPWKERLTPKAIVEMAAILAQERETVPLLGGMDTIVEAMEEQEFIARETLEEDLGAPLLPAITLSVASSQTEVGTVVDDDPLTEDDIIIDWSVLHYGMKEKDPMQLVAFYGKESPQTIGFVRPDQSGYLRPENFQELTVRCYARDEKKAFQIQEAFRKVLESLPTEFDDALVPSSHAPTVNPAEPTTPTANHFPASLQASPSNSPRGRQAGRSMSATPFATQPNVFTTIRPTPKPSSRKRPRGGENDADGDSPERKRRVS